MKEIRSTVVGNATDNPREKQFPNGDISAMVRIAVNSRYFDSSINDYSDRKTEFVNVYARRQLARNVIASVKKGQPLVATGRLGTSEWTGDDGRTYHSLTLTAETIGHDLTFGTAEFTKPPRVADIPDVDHDTGEIKDGAPAEGSEGLGSGGAEGLLDQDTAADDSLVASH